LIPINIRQIAGSFGTRLNAADFGTIATPDRRGRKTVLLIRLGSPGRIVKTNKPVFSVSVCLAGRVVPWHTFNLVGFGPVNLQACHSKHR
jgi:hypothetical protein